MEVIWPVLLLIGGSALVASGAALLARSLRGLQRVGVFGSVYWASFRRYAGYRLRALRPAVGALLGIALVGGGLGVLYFDLTTFYASRLGRIAG
jgi:hypothetical protein